MEALQLEFPGLDDLDLWPDGRPVVRRKRSGLTSRSGDDVFLTPDEMAARIVAALDPRPRGRILEPAAGGGAFVRALQPYADVLDTCEITEGRDFLACTKTYDWIVTNPPFSLLREQKASDGKPATKRKPAVPPTPYRRSFLEHALMHGVNVVFYAPLAHLIGMRARNTWGARHDMGLRQVLLTETPDNFPQSGFQWCAVHWEWSYEGPISWRDITRRGARC